MTKWQTQYAKYGKATYYRNREKRLKQIKAYQATRKEVYRVRNRKWASDHPERMRVFLKNYRIRNIELCQKRCRVSYSKHKAKYRNKKIISSAKRYRLKRSEIRAKWRAWALVNKPTLKAIWAKRRALKKNASINLSGIKTFISEVKAKPSVACYYCSKKISSKKIHFDHIVPLSRGGEHSVRNLCVACPRCNLSKHNKPLELWITVGQQLMRL